MCLFRRAWRGRYLGVRKCGLFYLGKEGASCGAFVEMVSAALGEQAVGWLSPETFLAVLCPVFPTC